MWVNDTDQANIRMFDVAPDGNLINGRVFAGGIRDELLAGLPDGMKADQQGNVYVTAPGGVWVYSFHGELLGKIECPEMVANLHWGGPDWSTLYLCASTSLYSVRTKVRGQQEAFMGAAGRGTTDKAAPAVTVPAPSVARSSLILKERLDFRIDPSRTAMILQDLQNDVMIDGGAFASTGSSDHARQQNLIANVARLAEAARAKGVMIIHVWMVIEPGAPYLAQHAALMQGLKSENALVRDTWG